MVTLELQTQGLYIPCPNIPPVFADPWIGRDEDEDVFRILWINDWYGVVLCHEIGVN